MSAAAQLAIVGAVVVAAAVYLTARAVRSARRRDACDCGCGPVQPRRR